MVKDHLGVAFESKQSMLNYYGISRGLYENRKRIGWNLEKILTTGVKEKTLYKDHLGKEYESLKSMCDAYGVSIQVYSYRINNDYSVEKALTDELKSNIVKKDTKGIEHRNTEELCRYYGVKKELYWRRKEKGWGEEEALEISGRGLDRKLKRNCGYKLSHIGFNNKRYYISRDGNIVCEDAIKIEI